MTIAEKATLTALEEQVKTLQNQLNIGTRETEHLKEQLRTTDQSRKDAEAQAREYLQRATKSEEYASELYGRVEILTEQLEDANNDVLSLNEDLSTLTKAQAQKGPKVDVLESEDGRKWQLTVEQFNLPGTGDHQRADVTSGSQLLERLVKLGAGILVEVVPTTAA